MRARIATLASAMFVMFHLDSFAQRPTSALPPCHPDLPESFPCHIPFDSGPVLERPLPTPRGTAAIPTVWVFVDETGRVANAQIDQPAGISYDLAAVGIARRLSFRPAIRAGRPLGVWINLAIATAEAITCPTMPVPVSAGDAVFVRSDSLGDDRGRVYRYVEPGSGTYSVYVYPLENWPTPVDQVRGFIRTVQSLSPANRTGIPKVVSDDDLRITVKRRRPPADIVFKGHDVVLHIDTPEGLQEVYSAVISTDAGYVSVQTAYRPSERATKRVRYFVEQLLLSVGSKDPRCR